MSAERREYGVAFIKSWAAIESRLALAEEIDRFARATSDLADGGGAIAGGTQGGLRSAHA